MRRYNCCRNDPTSFQVSSQYYICHMTELYQLLFTSIARNDMGDVELHELLVESARNNIQNDLTGMLAFRDGVFLETLEGERIRVFEAYDRILADDRHEDVQLLELGPIEARSFSTYKMCFDSQFEKTNRNTGNYMSCAEAESFLANIEQPTKAVVELLTMIC